MTREKAIKSLQFVRNALTDGMEIAKAYDMAIESLKQEPTTKNDLEVDCISRTSALDSINWAYNLSNAYQKINDLPSVTPQEPRWIPVSERMPEENRTVIASTEYGVYPEARYTKEDGWEWAYESGADYWEEIGCNVLAWMPLPKPYKAETEE